MRSLRHRPANISAVVLAPEAARSRAIPIRGGVARVVALETGGMGRLADAVRDRAAAESAEHRALWSGSLRGGRAPAATIASRPTKSSAPAPAWSPLLAAHREPARAVGIALHVGPRERCGLGATQQGVAHHRDDGHVHVTPAARLLGRLGAAAGAGARAERGRRGSRRAPLRSVLPLAAVYGRPQACLRLSPRRTRRTPGWTAGEGAPREACSWAMAATAVRSVEIPARRPRRARPGRRRRARAAPGAARSARRHTMQTTRATRSRRRGAC